MPTNLRHATPDKGCCVSRPSRTFLLPARISTFPVSAGSPSPAARFATLHFSSSESLRARPEPAQLHSNPGQQCHQRGGGDDVHRSLHRRPPHELDALEQGLHVVDGQHRVLPPSPTSESARRAPSAASSREYRLELGVEHAEADGTSLVTRSLVKVSARLAHFLRPTLPGRVAT